MYAAAFPQGDSSGVQCSEGVSGGPQACCWPGPGPRRQGRVAARSCRVSCERGCSARGAQSAG